MKFMVPSCSTTPQYCSHGRVYNVFATHFLQSSWTKQSVDIDSPQATSPLDQIAACPDSTCAQVIRPNMEISGNRGYMMPDGEEKEEKSGDEYDLVLLICIFFCQFQIV